MTAPARHQPPRRRLARRSPPPVRVEVLRELSELSTAPTTPDPRRRPGQPTDALRDAALHALAATGPSDETDLHPE